MTVIDIPDELTIEVTADDIQNGIRSDNCECAVARALKRIPGVQPSAWVEFGAASIEYDLDGQVYDLTLTFPPEATEFIQAFDCGDPVRPFTFTAELEEWS